MSKYVSWTLDELEDLLTHVEGIDPAVFAPALRAHDLPIGGDWRMVARLRGRDYLAILMASIDERLAVASVAESVTAAARGSYAPIIYNIVSRSVRQGSEVFAVSRRAAEHKSQEQLDDDERLFGFVSDLNR